jgi:predicted flap endonuclease-1-like 5' DNA nuclease
MFHNVGFGDNPWMEALISDIGHYLLAALAVGVTVGWLLKSVLGKSKISESNSRWQEKIDDISRQRNRSTTENEKLQKMIEAQQAVIYQREVAASSAQTELNSALEKEKLMAKNIFMLRGEREEFKTKMATFQSHMLSLQQRSSDLQSEFKKSRDFYVGQLKKSFDIRKGLQEKLENSYKEHESFRNLLNSSRSEHESVNRMLDNAKTRLENLDVLEQSVIALEADNAQLRLDASLAKQENDALNRDLAETEDLKIQNKELSQVLKSMENSRKQYENDAHRYRENSDKHEQKSETLRIRLDEVEKNFMEIELQQSDALKDARRPSIPKAANDDSPSAVEKDNLQDIIGIGKVFEHSLHELGYISFRQLANFSMNDIARVNAELKEFKGRMEQDDWIGQAKDFLYNKYGTGLTSAGSRQSTPTPAGIQQRPAN